MVITYNPSHSNINSEVNAPFKMLSLMLRFLENETKPTNKRPLRQPIEDYDDDGPAAAGGVPNPNSAFGKFQMPRHQEEEVAMDSGARMDTYNDDEDSYGSEGAGRRGFGNLDDEDRLSVNLDDLNDDDDSDDGAIDLNKPKQDKAAVEGSKTNAGSSNSSAEESKDENNTSGSDD